MLEKKVKTEKQTIHLLERKNNSKEAIIFIHGAGKTNYTWKNQYNLTGAYDLIFPNLPSHGKSSKVSAFSIDEYSNSIKDLLHSLNYNNYILVGHSMGGAIALTTALNYPELLKAIVIIDSAARLKVADFIFKAIEKEENILTKWAYCDKTPNEIIILAEQDFKEVSKDVRYKDFEACNRFDIRDKIKNIKVSTLILVGECDKLTPPKLSISLNKNIEKSTLKIVTNAGHMSMWENPKEINQQILNFLPNI